jgi:hypothetical protein
MRPIYLRPQTEAEHADLDRLYRTAPSPRFRIRMQAFLLAPSAAGTPPRSRRSSG